MAESVGSLVDKLCIAELKIFHMREQAESPGVAVEHRRLCQSRLRILRRQRDDLAAELGGLFRRWSRGCWTQKIYRQFKMYNDPRYRLRLKI